MSECGTTYYDRQTGSWHLCQEICLPGTKLMAACQKLCHKCYLRITATTAVTAPASSETTISLMTPTSTEIGAGRLLEAGSQQLQTKDWALIGTSVGMSLIILSALIYFGIIRPRRRCQKKGRSIRRNRLENNLPPYSIPVSQTAEEPSSGFPGCYVENLDRVSTGSSECSELTVSSFVQEEEGHASSLSSGTTSEENIDDQGHVCADEIGPNGQVPPASAGRRGSGLSSVETTDEHGEVCVRDSETLSQLQIAGSASTAETAV